LNRILLVVVVPVICFNPGAMSKQQYIPYVPVDFSVNVNLPAYIDLSVPSGHVLVNGGSQGIVLYRYTLDQFVALDRHATADIPSNCQVEVAEDGLMLIDPVWRFGMVDHRRFSGFRFCYLSVAPLRHAVGPTHFARLQPVNH
jgi:hypothetical protein